ncbi:BCCT family transporter [Modestobacter lapidis]
MAGQSTPEGQLFGVLETYPLATVMTVLVMVLVAIFFVSGADAASIVMGSLSERGTLEPTRRIVIFWGIVMGAVAAIMLLVGEDALTGLQNLTIIAALPFSLVMVGMAVALAKDLRTDPMMLRRAFASEAVEQAVVEGITRHGDDFALVVEPSPGADLSSRSPDPGDGAGAGQVGSPVPQPADRDVASRSEVGTAGRPQEPRG